MTGKAAIVQHTQCPNKAYSVSILSRASLVGHVVGLARTCKKLLFEAHFNVYFAHHKQPLSLKYSAHWI